MPARKTADQWFAEYDAHHQHRANRVLSWVCTPVILAALFGFVWTLPVPAAWLEQAEWFNWTLVAMATALFFYVRLSPALSAGLFFFLALCYSAAVLVELFSPWSVGTLSVIGFVTAWIGLMIGRIIERTIPSLPRDLAFVFLVPAWLVSRAYRKIGQKY